MCYQPHVDQLSSPDPVQLLARIRSLNMDYDVHGIIVQLPLDSTHAIDETLITNAVDPNKDVDG